MLVLPPTLFMYIVCVYGIVLYSLLIYISIIHMCRLCYLSFMIPNYTDVDSSSIQYSINDMLGQGRTVSRQNIDFVQKNVRTCTEAGCHTYVPDLLSQWRPGEDKAILYLPSRSVLTYIH